LLQGGPVEVDKTMEEGFVILSLRERVLGVGLLMQGTITSRIKQSESKRILT